jgi:hypothetical protein
MSVAAVGHEVLGSTSTKEKELGLAEAWKAEDLVKKLGAPEFFIYGTDEEIVAHIPRNLGSGETPSTERSPSRLGFMLSHIRFNWLRFCCVAVESFFGFNTVVVRIAECIIQRLLVKIRQNKYGE